MLLKWCMDTTPCNVFMKVKKNEWKIKNLTAIDGDDVKYSVCFLGPIVNLFPKWKLPLYFIYQLVPIESDASFFRGDVLNYCGFYFVMWFIAEILTFLGFVLFDLMLTYLSNLSFPVALYLGWFTEQKLKHLKKCCGELVKDTLFWHMQSWMNVWKIQIQWVINTIKEFLVFVLFIRLKIIAAQLCTKWKRFPSACGGLVAASSLHLLLWAGQTQWPWPLLIHLTFCCGVAVTLIGCCDKKKKKHKWLLGYLLTRSVHGVTF